MLLVPRSRRAALPLPFWGWARATIALALGRFLRTPAAGHLCAWRCSRRRWAARTRALAWILGTYGFTRYKKNTKRDPKLVLPEGVDGAEVTRIAEGVFLARDLVNTPSNDMGPEELAQAARALGENARREDFRRRWRCAAEKQLSADPCGGPRLAARAPIDRFHLGQARTRRK